MINDIKVNVKQAYDMVEKLKFYNKDYKFILYEDGDHVLGKYPWLRESLEWIKQFDK